MGRSPPDGQPLDELRRLEAVLDSLEKLVLKCGSEQRVSEKDEARYGKLIAEAQVLHGRLRHLLGVGVMEAAGRRWDAFQSVLGQPSISSLLLPYSTVDIWHESFKGAQSILRQTIGRAEELERQGGLGLSPEVIRRWSRVVNILESTRRGYVWLTFRPRFVLPLLERIEGSPAYRLARVFTTFAAFVAYLFIVTGLTVAVLLR